MTPKLTPHPYFSNVSLRSFFANHANTRLCMSSKKQMTVDASRWTQISSKWIRIPGICSRSHGKKWGAQTKTNISCLFFRFIHTKTPTTFLFCFPFLCVPGVYRGFGGPQSYRAVLTVFWLFSLFTNGTNRGIQFSNHALRAKTGPQATTMAMWCDVDSFVSYFHTHHFTRTTLADKCESRMNIFKISHQGLLRWRRDEEPLEHP